tara:strand:+ start:80 stop:649 length:570 start_codon:yes stop_codon:yes gene_type:complete
MFKKYKNKNLLIKMHTSEKGITIIEAVVASFIVAIGFISIYNLSSVITQQSINSIEREKATMLAVGMMEDMETMTVGGMGSNLFNFFGMADTNVNTSNSTNLGAANACDNKIAQINKSKGDKLFVKWCTTMDSITRGGVGVPLTNDMRNFYARIYSDGDNRKFLIITFVYSAKGGSAKKIFRKIINLNE